MERDQSDSSVEGWFALDKINQKVYASYRAYQWARNELKALEDFDLGRVFDVVGNFTGYDLQLRVLSDDQLRLSDELTDFEDDGALTIHRNWRIELEGVLQAAQLGEYSRLKNWLRTCQQKQEVALVDITLQNRLEMISSVLPDIGDPLNLPLPAWQDPRFNEENQVEDV